jgi:hypothetical protein
LAEKEVTSTPSNSKEERGSTAKRTHRHIVYSVSPSSPNVMSLDFFSAYAGPDRPDAGSTSCSSSMGPCGGGEGAVEEEGPPRLLKHDDTTVVIGR